jgi:hypothetical protein
MYIGMYVAMYKCMYVCMYVPTFEGCNICEIFIGLLSKTAIVEFP